MAETKIDPFDVAALEKSLNDSATRVSTIWVSFLIFSLYLLTAATTVTHRQLFLAEPVKLPVLNIDLPLWGFFFLAPFLFVIFHAYVLIQVILLARTAAAYDHAVNSLVKRSYLSPAEDASLRHRLANTLFAQIFAGSPRERAGWLGWLLKAMAWITLAIAPILILFVFQFMFLPYHSHLATWTHRLLIAVELTALLVLWPLVLDGTREFERPSAWTRIKRAAAMIISLLFVALSLSLGTFPGESHVNLFTGQPPDTVQCRRWLHQDFGRLDLRVDRLSLARVDVVDDEKLEKIQQATSKAGERPYQGERTRIRRERDYNCGDFSEYADLRRVDLSGALLRDADFKNTKLEGASLAGVQLQGASLEGAQLRGASLDSAHLQGASLDRAQLQGASLANAQLQGASLDAVYLQGASLLGANLDHAMLTEAWTWRTRLADCNRARIVNAKPDAAIDQRWIRGRAEAIPATAEEIKEFIASSVAGIPDEEAKKRMSRRMRERLTVDPANDNNALLTEAWHHCEAESRKLTLQDFEDGHVAILRKVVCNAEDHATTIGNGIARNWISSREDRLEFSVKLARALLGADDRVCTPAQHYDTVTTRILLNAVNRPTARPAAPAPK